ncbi:methyl-accepting chemotaxis protein [Pseudomonas indica]|uniref:Methyl-accepting chemotaxis protein-1, serine sensor receptor n=1 Tax=Pseudomonas indica TaxID=137658 RepID=A0A1G8XHV5_9PSED|nr:methyl-accepting chemotaxis protein [Pseudomonas indica]MBU3054890.1 methyl-accepting chemotaxis protein [Pseudomonas indica]PAU56809.1 chemotaxis protein [Pseudomonas indica]SDJ90178.1 methyl-accepting chemotaxis protein-1, serine sensor receptor [Pseudomonas indica]
MTGNLSVKAKLSLSFGVLTLILLVVSALSLMELSASNQRFSSYVQGISERNNLAAELMMAADQRAISARNMVLVSTPAEQEAERLNVTREHEAVQDLLARLKTAVAQAGEEAREEQKLVDEIARVEGLYGPVALDIVAKALSGDRDSAITKMNAECRPLLAELDSAVEAYLQHSAKGAKASEESANEGYVWQRNLLIGVCLVSIAIAVALALLITRSLTRALGAEPADLSAAAQRVASGDMRPVSGIEAAAAGSVLASLGEMQRNLSGLISQVRSSAEIISSAAEELSAATEQSSAGVSNQKLEVDQVATAIHEMAATVQEVARNSEDAANAALTADQQAQTGEKMAKQALVQIERLAAEVIQSASAMARLKQESEHIGGVLDVIKSVADQTNLLALNAAIEAARAGDAGRGFAVVADEVRNLAKRTQGATQEIEGLIASLQRIAEEAAGMMEVCRSLTDETVTGVGNAGDAVMTITQMIANIQQMVRQIATAAEEQSAVAEEINRSVTKVRDIADQSAAATGQTAASSNELARLGSTLQQQVRRFQV